MSTLLESPSIAELHRKKHNQITRLSEKHFINPYPVLEEFFSCYHLSDTRKLMWDWLQAGLTSKHGNFKSGKDRSDLLFFYQRIEEMIEAAYLLLQEFHTRIGKTDS